MLSLQSLVNMHYAAVIIHSIIPRLKKKNPVLHTNYVCVFRIDFQQSLPLPLHVKQNHQTILTFIIIFQDILL